MNGVTHVFLRPLDDEPLPEFVPVSAELDGLKLAFGRVSTQYRDDCNRIVALVFECPVFLYPGQQLLIKVVDPYLVKRFGIEIGSEL